MLRPAIILAVLSVCAGSSRGNTEAVLRATTLTSEATFVAVGDIIFGRYSQTSGKRRLVAKSDDAFAEVRGLLSNADLCFGNLETPALEEPEKFKPTGPMIFRADPRELDQLSGAGFDVLSIANNHIFNFGHAGAPKSRENIEASDMRAIGAGATTEEAFEGTVFVKNGIRIAFAAYTVWTNGRDESTDEGAVAFISQRHIKTEFPRRVRELRAKTRADFVVISIHWGQEKAEHPEDWQRRAAHKAIDAGADMILGHHPHVIQDFEMYKGKLIAYSLGNFLFDNPSRSWRETVILGGTLRKTAAGTTLNDATLHPIIIERERRIPVPSASRPWRKRLTKLARRLTVAANKE